MGIAIYTCLVDNKTCLIMCHLTISLFSMWKFPLENNFQALLFPQALTAEKEAAKSPAAATRPREHLFVSSFKSIDC